EGSRQGDSLLFASGDFAGLFLSHFFDPKGDENFAYPLLPSFLRQISQSVGNVFFRGQMRKQRQGLKHVSDSPLLSGNMDSRDGIEENIVADSDSTLVRLRQPGDTIQQSRFAGARSPKQNRDAGRNFDGNIEEKGSSASAMPFLADLSGEHRTGYFAVHGVHTRRFTAKTKDNTAKEIARRTKAVRFAAPYS